MNYYFTESKLWEAATLASAMQVKETFELNIWRLLSNQHSDFVICNKWEHMGLSKHLQVSVMAGLFDKYNGASNYINDRPSPSHVTKTFACRTKTREQHLDVNILARQKIPPLEEKMQATHVVVGVFYGAEAYCVFTHDLDGKKESQPEIEENLSVLVDKWNDSLKESQDLYQFKEKFSKEEKQLLQLTKCRLYSDLQTEAVRECSVFDAYKQCLIFIDRVQHSRIEIKKRRP